MHILHAALALKQHDVDAFRGKGLLQLKGELLVMMKAGKMEEGANEHTCAQAPSRWLARGKP